MESFYAIAKYAFSGGRQSVSLQQAAAVPYASIGVRLGDGPQIMLIQAGDTERQILWTSAARIAITTQGGRIIQTAGLPHDLGGYEARGNVSIRDVPQTVRWQADFPDIARYSVSITCQDRPSGEETITILGKNINTQRIDESCSSEGDALDWAFRNVYWIDPVNGLVWRSLQHVHPKLDAIETEVLRPPF